MKLWLFLFLLSLAMVLTDKTTNISAWWIVLGAIAILWAREYSYSIYRQTKRKRYYQQALRCSKEKQKPLLVVGDPYNGVGSKELGVSYGCGDLCMDLTGCPKCPQGLKGRLEDTLKTIPSNKYVVFVSCVLEYVDDIDLCIRELERISGGDLYVVYVSSETLVSYIYIGESTAKRTILSAPPTARKIRYRKNIF